MTIPKSTRQFPNRARCSCWDWGCWRWHGGGSRPEFRAFDPTRTKRQLSLTSSPHSSSGITGFTPASMWRRRPARHSPPSNRTSARSACDFVNGSVQFVIRTGVSVTLVKPSLGVEQTFTFCLSVGPARPVPEFRDRHFLHFRVLSGRSAPRPTDRLEPPFPAKDLRPHRLSRACKRGQSRMLPRFVEPQSPFPIPLS